MDISLGWKLSVTSLVYKPQKLELIQKKYPMPLVGIENRWSLNKVGFSLRDVKVKNGEDESTVLIQVYSNYLENPFHLFVSLSIDNSAEIHARIWIENRHKKRYHDIYREEDDSAHIVFREKSDINWRFNSLEEALWPSADKNVAINDSVIIFDGILGIFEGDWHHEKDFKYNVEQQAVYLYGKLHKEGGSPAELRIVNGGHTEKVWKRTFVKGLQYMFRYLEYPK
jgi:hypothetical protein